MIGWTRWPRPLTPARRQQLSREIEEELQFHLEMRREDNRREGMEVEEAQMDALERFGDVERIATACLRAEEDHPLRTARRLLATTLMLAVGFGAIALAFGLAYTALLKPLRFSDADQLVRVGEGWTNDLVPMEDFVAWRTGSRSFEHLTAFNATTYTLTGRGNPSLVRAMVISGGYFDAFDIAPILGRPFAADEVEHHAADVTLISEELWINRFGRSPSILGKTLDLDGRPRTIVGVMPIQGQLTHKVDLWTPLRFGPDFERERYYVIGRLNDGITLAEARREIEVLADEVEATDHNAEASRMSFYPLRDLYTAPVRSVLQILLLAAVLVLILIWAVSFRRALARAEERCILSGDSGSPGTHRWTEDIGVALVAAALGLAISQGLRSITYGALLGRWGTVFDQQNDGTVVAIVLIAAGLTAVALRLIPWLTNSSGGRHASLRRGLERGLSISVVAVTVVLLVAFGQRAKSFFDADHASLGFDDAHLLTVDLPGPNNTDSVNVAALYTSIVDEIRSLPQVEAVSFSRAIPFRANRLMSLPVGIVREGSTESTDVDSRVELIGPDYFQTMGIPVLEGNPKRWSYGDGGVDVAVVNTTFARTHWPTKSAIGRRIDVNQDGRIRTVVGVVGDVRYFGGSSRPLSIVYVPHAQLPAASVALLFRSTANPDQFSASLRNAVHRVSPNMPIGDTETVSAIRHDAGRSERANLWILGLMALASLICAAFGTMQLISDHVRKTLVEFEHERARGAHAGMILLRAWRPGLSTVSAGIALGLVFVYVFTHNVWPDLLGEIDNSVLFGASVVSCILMLSTSLFSARQALAIAPAKEFS